MDKTVALDLVIFIII
ncbi:hypothetical protein KM1_265200 [Entamoeba histolytica HM-3:IMSS]|uniref:Uncharacterized protein n=1 Tax=Entamoeba histolytica HM-3:IMSS TaxID=885315 RepID=M7WC69_ENTHI|nr:hypothetical protein KM1_265200 [Entamoeba histolytica HM-3:IMSS]